MNYLCRAVAIAFFVLLSACSAFADSFLVISDIDDTIKISNARNTSSAVSSVSSNDSFLAMAELYNGIYANAQNQNDHSLRLSNNECRFHYITGNPFRSRIQTYLKEVGFPGCGGLHTKSIFEDMFDFKYSTHLDVISSQPTQTVILVGDNGQIDPDVFQKLVEDLSSDDRKVFSFIHRIHTNDSTKFMDSNNNQFLTFFDLGLQLIELGVVDQVFLAQLFDRYVDVFEDDEHSDFFKLLPEWSDCQGFGSYFEEIATAFEEGQAGEGVDELDHSWRARLDRYQNFLDQNCN